ncbi:Rrf2 family transcriptional regulator [Winogradskyella sp.]|uniref:RrF2 family transcriptional regulator n=1 Tax=Winogradskyella sp. TaxID=1883156 RepID=UPI0026359809|nr:Rrf2 family transcriptional regulator [Winogradskyella sp.]
MFSNSTKYAIKAVLYLAVNSSEEKKVVVNDMAGLINVPKAYIAKILQELSKKNLISSTRGPKGGFYLSEDNKKAKVYDIVIAMDEEQRMNSCLLSLKKCNIDNPCSLHHLAYNEKEAIIRKLNNTSLEELVEHIKTGKSVFPI